MDGPRKGCTHSSSTTNEFSFTLMGFLSGDGLIPHVDLYAFYSDDIRLASVSTA